MSQALPSIEEMLRSLPPEAQDEARDFIRFLAEKNVKKNAHKTLSLTLRGALRDWRDEYTSVELQHKALDWWSE
jgi:hypothetical protein